MKLHDNITQALATLLYHEGAFALTASAIRRIVYASTGRGEAGGGWSVGFARIRGKYITSSDMPRVLGRPTWRLTEKGRERLAKRETLPRAFDVDPDAWLRDSHRYVRA